MSRGCWRYGREQISPEPARVEIVPIGHRIPAVRWREIQRRPIANGRGYQTQAPRIAVHWTTAACRRRRCGTAPHAVRSRSIASSSRAHRRRGPGFVGLAKTRASHHAKGTRSCGGHSRNASADPPHPPPHVITESREGTPFSQLLLIKLETPCDEMLEGGGGNTYSGAADVIAEPIKAFLNPSYKGLLGMFG